MQHRANLRRVAAFILIAFLTSALPVFAAGGSSGPGTTISGRILDMQGGLPVPNATIELYRNGTKVAEGQTDASGRFRIPNQVPGTYFVLVRANGFETTRLTPDLLVSSEVPEVSFQMAIGRQRQGLKQIGYVATSGMRVCRPQPRSTPTLTPASSKARVFNGWATC